MARTTLNLDQSVLRQLRRRARREGKSMGEVASELLARAFSADPPAAEKVGLSWRTADLGLPRVDLEDAEAVRAALERTS